MTDRKRKTKDSAIVIYYHFDEHSTIAVPCVHEDLDEALRITYESLLREDDENGTPHDMSGTFIDEDSGYAKVTYTQDDDYVEFFATIFGDLNNYKKH